VVCRSLPGARVTSVISCRVYRSFRTAGEARLRACLAAVLVGFSAAGCSISFPMTSLLPDDGPDATSSLKKPASPLSPKLGDEDWRRAKAALTVALDPQGNGATVSWENPDSGLKGGFTPTGKPFVKADTICRGFHALLTGKDTTATLQGTACRPSGGEWSVQDVKPATKAG
jgi:17 kDa outer membrane surface antigen